jgi:ABC-2 type transport system permease protein
MNSFRASLINELEKIVLRRKTAVLLLAALLFPALLAILEGIVRSDFGFSLYRGSGFAVAVLGIMTDFALPLLLFMQAADCFAGELSDGSIKLSWMRPLARWKLFASKQLSLLIMCCLFLTATWIGAALSTLLLQLSGLSIGSILDSMLAYTVALLPMAALSTAAVWINQWVKSPTAAIILSLLFYMGTKLSVFFLSSLFKYTPAAYTDWHLLWLGGIGWNKLGSIFLFLAGCSIVCITMALIQFERKAA